MPRWGYLAVVGGLLVLLVGKVVLSRMARPKPWFTYSMSPLGPADYEALARRPGWSKSTLTMPDGVMLAGLLRRPTQQGAAWLLFFPGNDATQLARGQRVLEQIAGDHGWGLALYASRGYDASGGTPSAAAFASDANRILTALLQDQQLKPSQLHLVAFSLGGYSAVSALTQAAKQSQKLASLSLLASVARVAMVHSDPLSRFRTGDIYDVLPMLGDVATPTLIVQGGADEAFAGAPQGTLLAQRLGERGRYLELPGVGHNSLLDDAPALMAVRDMVVAHSAP